ncbi:leucine rich repeat, Ig-like and transmembrane domains 3 [Rhinolophus ferrumequinum]|uniref:Leucine rich repeat, Ig-like and transmembrane domains 3 n=1 Tax=Rhinolophus ferrumequinum TaxID=59479 RepID=A0A7J7ZD62_RHIFE|nr:leucine rich repeat, Ig-like and transmembrane domains 3 [Rhinolophus ferrumequinum]
MHLLTCLGIVLSFLEGVSSSCPSQCTCDYHSTNDGTGSRSVLCNDLDMNEVPVNLPADTVKLRIEKTVIRRIPAEAFYYLVQLQYLWVTYNSVASLEARSFYNLRQLHELRLDGNSLAAFPWASLLDMPHLRTLDLHNNRITRVPNAAVRYLKNLAYLDLSSNKLTTLPPEFLESWSHVLTTSSGSLDLSPRRIILGLQDNPWFCDCHISKVIEMSKVADPAIVLLDPLMVCSGPERLTGILFQRAELDQCLKPSVMTSATQITSTLGSNVLLRCDATGYPTPQLTWTRPSSSPVNYTVVSSTTTLSTRMSTSTTVASQQSLQFHPDGKRNLKVEMGGRKLPSASASKKEELALLDRAMPMETNATIENLRAVSETKERVTLMWNIVNTTHSSEVTVLYSKYGEKNLLLLNADSSKSQVSISGLEPGRQYIACVCPKGALPQKDECIIFSTDRVEEESDSQGSFLIVVSGTACVVVLPLILFLLYKVCKLQCKSQSFWEDDLAKETYIQFETLSPRSQSVGELWAQRHRDDSEKLLLCSRSSVESQMTFKSEGSRPEYYC